MKNIYLASALTTSLLLVSCSNDDGTYKFENSEPGAKAVISATIGDMTSAVATRVSGTQWGVGDEIGISSTDNYTTNYDQKNFLYRATSVDGAFQPADLDNSIWFLGANEFQITAYYPYSGAIGVPQGALAAITSSEFQTAEKQPKIDFLFAVGTASYENPAVELSFYHKMSRLQLQFVSQTDASGSALISDLGTLDCYAMNIVQTGTFDTAAGTAVADEQNGDAVTDKNIYQQVTGGNGHKFSVILFPQPNTGKARVDVVMKNTDNPKGIYYKLPLPELQLEAGKSHDYTVTAKLTNDNKITLEISKGTVNDWIEIPGGIIDPTPGKVDTSVQGAEVEGWTDSESVPVVPTQGTN